MRVVARAFGAGVDFADTGIETDTDPAEEARIEEEPVPADDAGTATRLRRMGRRDATKATFCPSTDMIQCQIGCFSEVFILFTDHIQTRAFSEGLGLLCLP